MMKDFLTYIYIYIYILSMTFLCAMSRFSSFSRFSSRGCHVLVLFLVGLGLRIYARTFRTLRCTRRHVGVYGVDVSVCYVPLSFFVGRRPKIHVRSEDNDEAENY